MNLNTRLLIAINILAMLLLASCGTTKVTYEEGFPTKHSPALRDFMRYYMTNSTGNFLFKNGNKYVYSKINGNSDLKSVDFYYVEKDELKKEMEVLLTNENSQKAFNNLTKDSKSLSHKIKDIDEYDLPHITLKGDNKLKIKTKKDQTTIDLPDVFKEYNLDEEDRLIINVTEVANNAFSIDIRNTEKEKKEKFLQIYAKKDFSDLVFISSYYDSFNKHLTNGDLDEFTDLISVEESESRYVPIKGGYGALDTKKDEVIPIDDGDYLSEDDQFVYLGGNEKSLSDGVQQIQPVEDYTADNDTYEAEFKISFKEIAKKLGFKTSGVGKATINYFDKDYIMLRLNYDGRIIGKEGETNVIIDLQEEENPTVYLVDLDRM